MAVRPQGHSAHLDELGAETNEDVFRQFHGGPRRLTRRTPRLQQRNGEGLKLSD
jgi:hypothetical protein